ncbi:cation:proton antiporter [Microbacterium sp.]|uniref:cation:proton antiporter n=1 Tax=Microbacterium sp. TaxID=51671 RepID=UPI003F9E1943
MDRRRRTSDPCRHRSGNQYDSGGVRHCDPPEIILAGVLPPLLYSAAVSAPAIEFRRDLAAIGGLSVLLVIISSLLLGLFFFWLMPEIGFPLAVALGAILSPTDAVATSVVRKLGVPRRVVTVLEGESLLNDATALVVLRTALVAVAAGFSVLTTLGSFAWSVVAALLVGAVIGMIALRLRAWTSSPTANTAIGLTVPYLAYLPTEALGGSGLVAAVVAGLVCGQGALRWLTPEQRVSDKLNWQTIEFLLEGAIFLTMGLELYGIVQSNIDAGERLLRGAGIAALAFVVLMIIRAVYVIPVLSLQSAHAKKMALKQIDGTKTRSDRRVRKKRADFDYFDASPLTWKHNTIIIWAGMRGAVTLAAAQTLPKDTPERDLLIFIAFVVAAGSLMLQGLTLPVVARWLGLRKPGAGGPPRKEVRTIDRELRRAADAATARHALVGPNSEPFSDAMYTLPRSWRVTPLELPEGTGAAEVLSFELALLGVMRARMHELGRSGRHTTSALRYVLDELDAYEISIKLRLESER